MMILLLLFLQKQSLDIFEHVNRELLSFAVCVCGLLMGVMLLQTEIVCVLSARECANVLV